MSWDEITQVGIAPLGQPGTGVSGSEWTSYKSEVDALMARPNITSVGVIPDVALAGLAGGHILQWDATALKWKNVAIVQGLTALKVNNASVLAPALKLNFSSAFAAAVNGSDSTQADVSPNFGTAANTFRAGNQSANPAIRNNWQFSATGVLSSGTRTLSSTTSDVLVSGVPYDWKATFHFAGRNNVNNGDVTIKITGPGGASRSRNVLTVGGVPRDPTVAISGLNFTGTGAGATITTTVTYLDNDPTDILDGYVEFDADPRR